MPRFDGTGPDGKGKKTGRGLGTCNGNEPKLKPERPFGQGSNNRKSNSIRRRFRRCFRFFDNN